MYYDYLFGKTGGNVRHHGAIRARQDDCHQVSDMIFSQRSLQLAYWGDETRRLRETFEYPDMRFSDLVSSNDYFVLEDSLRIRREWQGCIVADQKAKELYAYNPSAYSILCQLRRPCRVPDLLTTLHKAYATYGLSEDRLALHIRSFISDLVALSLVRSTDDLHRTSNSMFYNDTMLEFPEDRLVSPYSAALELTYKCHRECAHCCFRSSPVKDTSAEQGYEFWKDVIDQLVSSVCLVVELTGGEPFLKDTFPKIIEYIEASGLLYILNSDATHWGPQCLELVEGLQRLVSVQFSIDGSSQEIYGRLRGAGTLVSATNTMRRLTSRGIPVTFGSTMYADNVSDIQNMTKLAADIGTRYMVSFMLPQGRAEDNRLPLCSASQTKAVIDAYCDAIENGSVVPLDSPWQTIACEVRGKYPEVYSDIIDYFSQARFRTFPAHRTIRINPYGEAYITGKIDSNRELLVGDLRDHSLSDVWNGTGVIAYLRRLTDHDQILPCIDVNRILV